MMAMNKTETKMLNLLTSMLLDSMRKHPDTSEDGPVVSTLIARKDLKTLEAYAGFLTGGYIHPRKRLDAIGEEWRHWMRVCDERKRAPAYDEAVKRNEREMTELAQHPMWPANWR